MLDRLSDLLSYVDYGDGYSRNDDAQATATLRIVEGRYLKGAGRSRKSLYGDISLIEEKVLGNRFCGANASEDA